MRNLVALRRSTWRLDAPASAPDEDVDDGRAATAFALNAAEQCAYVLQPRGRVLQVPMELEDDAEDAAAGHTLVDLATVVPREEAASEGWRWIAYVAELDAVVCGSAGGALVAVDAATGAADEIGALDGGIRAMAWTADQERVAVATGVGTLLVMNTAWDVLHESRLPGAAAVRALCWRDDGKYLAATLAAAAGDGEGDGVAHELVVLTDELAPHATGRFEDGRAIPRLGATLAWAPDQSLLASHEARKDQLAVVFFERNGLRHGEFSLPSEWRAATSRVLALAWSAASDVLAVHVADDARGRDRVLLWSRNNYHWFLKQQLCVRGLRALRWDDERALVLHALGDAAVERLEFAWDVCSGDSEGDSDAENDSESTAVVGVIDGATLQLTPVHRALVPPPMALHALSFAAPVNALAFDVQRGTSVVALLATGDVELVDDALSEAPARRVVVRASDVPCALSSLLFAARTSPSRLVVGAKTQQRDALVVLAVSIDGDSDGAVRLLVPSQELDGVARGAATATAGASTAAPLSFAVQRHDGAVFELRVPAQDDDVEVSPLVPPGAAAVFQRFELVRVAATSTSTSAPLVLGLSATGKLSVVDGAASRVLSVACSSFRVSREAAAVVLTTLAQLRLVPLSALLAAGPSVEDAGESRVIERGARLVAVLGDRARVVLELPRGNLEAVAPRLLVLVRVVRHVERLELLAALEMSRRHRVDLNLLVDLDAARLLTHLRARLVDAYVASRPPRVTSDRLCLFVTTLHVNDVWSGKYAPLVAPFLPALSTAAAAATAAAATALGGVDKVNSVCRALMDTIERDFLDVRGDQLSLEHADALLLPYLTSAVKQAPPDYHAALRQVQRLVRMATPAAATHARRAIQHLLLLAPVDVLFDEALGLYDLELARVVATHLQRDPREYAPLLDALSALEDETTRRFRIDAHLKRHASALTHASELLSRRPEHAALADEVAAIVERSELFDHALRLFPAQSPVEGLHARVLRLKAAALAKREQWRDAGLVLLAVGDLRAAMDAFKTARAWQLALSAAHRAKLSQRELAAFAHDVAQALLRRKDDVPPADVEAAARLLVDYCADVDEAVALLVKHKLWDDALRVAGRHGRQDLVETDVEPGVRRAADALQDEIATRQREYVAHWRRLTTIREQKRLFRLHGIDGRRWGDAAAAGDDGDSVAASSVADSALSAASSLRSVGSHNSSAASLGNFAMKSLATATASHFYATQTLSTDAAASAAQAYKSKRYNGMPSRAERRRRVKKGSVEEELQVAQELRAHAPSAALCRETRDVLQALVLLGHSAHAEKLQLALAAFETLIAREHPLLPLPAAEGQSPSEDGAISALPAWRFPSIVDAA
ncbi:hypothetical protein P43SY_001412 [Pythium insidiosum]|uniref:Elongator complex protein 1 n=1 Tax=Pythium insidiosum TaxID=114742 RepID=A0AAD5LK15_PYTIN|nr:hypothetical protein P43SY_001412 [Pythium insidiosum]